MDEAVGNGVPARPADGQVAEEWSLNNLRLHWVPLEINERGCDQHEQVSLLF